MSENHSKPIPRLGIDHTLTHRLTPPRLLATRRSQIRLISRKTSQNSQASVNDSPLSLVDVMSRQKRQYLDKPSGYPCFLRVRCFMLPAYRDSMNISTGFHIIAYHSSRPKI